MIKMRIHPLCLLLVAVLPFSVSVSTAGQTSCIDGCKCTADVRTLNVRECDGPFDLTKESLTKVSKHITTIGFKNVDIKRIDADAFQLFNSLESIVFEDVSINHIDPSAFLLPELGTLRFTRTLFGENPTLSSEYLDELIFDDCQLTEIPNLDHLPGLTYLKVTHNLIEHVDPVVFQQVDGLEEIILSNNMIKELPADLFVNNVDLNSLTVDNNPLKKFALNSKIDIEMLSLRNCNLTSFDRPLAENLALLTTLHLSGNDISVLPIDSFEPMTKLNTLDLSDNKLVELDDDIFRENVDLFKVNLNNNPFKALPKFQSKSGSFKIYEFSCKNCGLASVASSFDQMTALVVLDLSDNKLADIDGLFLEMSGLNEVNLRNNQITNIGINSFGNNSKLDSLDLSHNPLQPLDPVVLASLQSLKKLNVSSCELQTLWANHNSVLPSLEQLFVVDNKLSTMTIDDLRILPKLKLLAIQSLPCNDDSTDFVDYLTKNAIYPQESWIKTHDNLNDGVTNITAFNPKRAWSAIYPPDCVWDNFDEDYDSEEDFYEDDKDEDDDFDGKDDDGLVDDDLEDDEVVEASVLNGMNLTKVSYILSVTTVFILTALLVLFVAVVITLLILKRNKSLNMHNGNLPRLKIPLWHSTPGHKKHSGSIYKPLSEEVTGSRIMNWYDFKQTPQVHNSLP